MVNLEEWAPFRARQTDMSRRICWSRRPLDSRWRLIWSRRRPSDARTPNGTFPTRSPAGAAGLSIVLHHDRQTDRGYPIGKACSE